MKNGTVNSGEFPGCQNFIIICVVLIKYECAGSNKQEIILVWPCIQKIYIHL